MTTTAEPGTGVALYEEPQAPALRVPVMPNLPDTDTWIRAMASIAKLASQICNTSFVPKGMRGDDAAVTACILTGRELGLGPMTSLRHIHVVEGVPSLDAEYKRAKVQSLGHEFDIIEWDHDCCVVSGRRKGSQKPPLIVSYTIGDARRAELVKAGSNYVKRPKVMMLARATTLMCSALFSDVTNGLATTELLESGDADAVADAIGTSMELPALPPPPVEDLRRRAAAHTIASTVVTPDVPPAAPESPVSGPAAVPDPPAEVAAAGGTPRATDGQCRAIAGKLTSLGVTDPGAVIRTAGLIAGQQVERLQQLHRDKAGILRQKLDDCDTPEDLDLLRAEAQIAGEPREDGEPDAG